MSPEIISLIGFAVAAVVFGLLCYKGVHIIPSSLLAAAILCIMSGMPVYSTLTDVYMPSFANFIKSYYLLLYAGAFFARVMADGGAVAGIAYRIVKLAYRFPKKYQKVVAVCCLPLINFIIVYGGITVYAAVFTLVAIAKEIFDEMDINWGYYAVASLGSGKIAQFFPGSAEAVNLLPIEYFGTTPLSGTFIGIMGALAMYAFAVVYVFISVNRDERNNIGFLPAGAEIARSELMEIDKEHLQPLWKCLLPMIIMWCALNLLSLPAPVALFIASIVAMIIFYKTLRFKASLAESAIRAITSLSLLCSVVAYGAVLANTPGYNFALTLVDKIPGGAAFKVWLTCLIITPILNSASGGITVILKSLGDQFLATGIAPGALHRLVVVSSMGLNSLPHNSGTATIAAVGKVEYKYFYIHLFWTSLVGATVGSIVVMLLVSMGIYI